MRYSLLLTVILGFVCLPVPQAGLPVFGAGPDAKNEWVSNGPWGGLVLGLEISKSNPQCIFAFAPGGGNFISIDGAKTWQRINLPSAYPDPKPITLIKDTLYISNGSVLYQSKDLGKTWTQAADFGGKEISLITGGLGSKEGVYCLLYNYKSSYDASEEKTTHNYTWFWASQPGGTAPGPEVVPENKPMPESGWPESKIGVMSYKTRAGTAGHWFYKYATFSGDSIIISVRPMASDSDDITLQQTILYTSRDNGKSWTRHNVSGNMHVLYSPKDRENIYGVAFLPVGAAKMQGIFKSGDGGKTWSSLNERFDNKPARFMVFHPVTGDIYIGTHADGLFVSRDNGKTWEALNNGLHNLSVSAIAFDPVNADIIYCGTQHGIFKTVNRGKEWRWSGDGVAASQATGGLYVDPTDPKTVYLPEFTSGVRISCDAGKSWEPHQLVRPFSNTYYIAGNKGVLMLETDTGCCRSVDSGKTWLLLQSLKDRKPYGFICPANNEMYCLDAKDKKLLRSADNGDSWIEMPGPPEEIGMPMRVIKNGQQMVCIGYKGIVLSKDSGLTWQTVNVNYGKDKSFFYITASCFDPADSDIIYVGGMRTEKKTQYVYRINLATSKTKCIFKETTKQYPAIVNIQFDPADKETMIVATAHGGIYISRQKGRDWNNISGNLPTGNISAMAVSSDRVIYVCASGAVYSMNIPEK